MANPSKQKGTAAETAVVRYLRDFGYQSAERLPLAGQADVGDVRVFPGLHLEVKAGNAAHSASISQCERWMREAEREAFNAGCPVFLVVKRKGTTDVGQWRFFCRLGDLTINPHQDALMETTVLEALGILLNDDFPGVDTSNQWGEQG